MNENKSTLTNEQRKVLSKRMVNMQVSLLEQEVILQLRKVGHGKFVVQMLDNVPFRYEKNTSHFFEEGDAFAILREEKKGGE